MTIQNQFDLVILGGTPGGLAAAIAAARLGKRSAILERTPFIGGLPANGLGATDIATRGATGGIFLEFVQRVKSYYIEDIEEYGLDSDQVKDSDDGYHFEPAVAEHVFKGFVAEYPNITVLVNRQFDFEPCNLCIEAHAVKSIQVTNLETGHAETHTGTFFLDALMKEI
jgi:2-polyprenyl-6-methoxyphenol hydroxylase-like FAD-dependent oxidoreductase